MEVLRPPSNFSDTHHGDTGKIQPRTIKSCLQQRLMAGGWFQCCNTSQSLVHLFISVFLVSSTSCVFSMLNVKLPYCKDCPFILNCLSCFCDFPSLTIFQLRFKDSLLSSGVNVDVSAVECSFREFMIDWIIELCLCQFAWSWMVLTSPSVTMPTFSMCIVWCTMMHHI